MNPSSHPSSTNSAIISIGSNSPDKSMQIDNCIQWLSNLFEITDISDIYTTPAINGKDPEYLNCVASIISELSFEELSTMMKDFEADCGRTPQSKQNGSVPIDLDIVIWNGDVIRERDFEQHYFQIGWKEIND